MRTPGHDFELAAGSLFAEDIISSASQIRGITNSAPNIVELGVSVFMRHAALAELCRHVLTKACLKEFRSASTVNKRHVQVLATALHSKSQ
jgi:formate dehydrogenase assembly factor FdhD